MDEILTERAGNILRIQLNRPKKRNAMTSAMYVTLADIFKNAAKDDLIRVVLWHGAGDSFCAGNVIEDFLKNPPGPGESPQAQLRGLVRDCAKDRSPGRVLAGGLSVGIPGGRAFVERDREPARRSPPTSDQEPS